MTKILISALTVVLVVCSAFKLPQAQSGSSNVDLATQWLSNGGK